MQVSVQSSDGLERRITVTVPAERVEKEVETRLKSLARRVRLDGFRPGKVPFSVVQRKYGDQVLLEVRDEVVQSSFREAVAQQQLRPAGSPRIESHNLDTGRGLEYTAVFEVYPEIGQVSLDGVKIDKPAADITDSDVNAVIDRLRKQRADWVAVERAAQDGDRLIIDFAGTMDGKPFEGGEGKQVPIVLGAQMFIAGFEEGLIGAKVNDELTLDLQFPAEYHAAELAGKPVRFAVKVTAISEPKLPEVDEDFVKAFGVSEGGESALRAEVRNNMQRELEQLVKRKVKQQVLDGLLQANPLTLPRALVDAEIGELMQQAADDLAGRGVQMSRVNLQPAMFEEQARRRVALGLILSELIRKNGFKATQERVHAVVEAAAASYENPAEVISWYYANPQRLAGVEAMVLEDQAVDWVVENVAVNEVRTSFDELMKTARS